MEPHLILQSQTADEAYQKACADLDEQPKTLEQFTALHGEAEGKAHHSLHRIATVIRAVKGDHKFDWNNYDEYKYYPWFDMETYGEDAVPGSGFSFYDYVCDGTYSLVGARLSLHTREDAEAIGKLMLEDYKNWMKD